MSEAKRYTAQEMREKVKAIELIPMMGLELTSSEKLELAAMLRQAADAEDELAKAKRPDACPANPTNKMCYLPGEYCCDAVRYLQNENARLAARLAAVVKECEKQIPACRGDDCKCNPTDGGYCDENCHDEIIVHTAVTAILRAARGESENENK